jgi:hypothetical protein
VPFLELADELSMEKVRILDFSLQQHLVTSDEMPRLQDLRNRAIELSHLVSECKEKLGNYGLIRDPLRKIVHGSVEDATREVMAELSIPNPPTEFRHMISFYERLEVMIELFLEPWDAGDGQVGKVVMRVGGIVKVFKDEEVALSYFQAIVWELLGGYREAILDYDTLDDISAFTHNAARKAEGLEV